MYSNISVILCNFVNFSSNNYIMANETFIIGYTDASVNFQAVGTPTVQLNLNSHCHQISYMCSKNDWPV